MSAPAIDTNALLAILINQVAIPELTQWLLSRGNKPLDDTAILQKLASDTDLGARIGQAWLDSHPTTAPTPVLGPALSTSNTVAPFGGTK